MTHYYTDNSDLVSNRKQFDYYFGNEKFVFTTDNGVFSKGNVDYGSYLLIKNTYNRKLGKSLLDLGCGYGPIGIIIKRFNNDIKTYMVDVNSRAIELANLNCLNNKTDINVYLCDDILNLDLSFDSILLNPPIRAGKKVIYDLYHKAYKCLNEEGSLYIVIAKKQGALSSINELKNIFKNVYVLDKDGGYLVIQASK